jgi:hypothetical protein
MKIKLTLLFFICSLTTIHSQEDQLGAWYMYFYTHKFKESKFGIQGDIQYRNNNIVGDLEQLLLRSGLTYNPKNTNVTLTLGVANITTGVFGDSNETTNENRIYQEVLLPQKVGERIYLTHRFRYEQRFVENQDFRTRYRYNIFMNIPINKKALTKNAIFVAFYNELFINGEKNIGNNRRVNVFDRNRFYSGLGYNITDKLRVQAGYMNQSLENFSKNQLQFSVHHNF